MSKFLKVIVNILLLAGILSAGALVLPTFLGITPVVSEGTGNTNMTRGSVTYVKALETSGVSVGDQIYVDDGAGEFLYRVKAVDTASGSYTLENEISGETVDQVLQGGQEKALLTIPFLGFLSIAAQSKEGMLIIGLSIVFLIILFILSEVWKEEEDDEDDEDEDDEDELEETEEEEEEEPGKETRKERRERKKLEKQRRREEEEAEEDDSEEDELEEDEEEPRKETRKERRARKKLEKQRRLEEEAALEEEEDEEPSGGEPEERKAAPVIQEKKSDDLFEEPEDEEAFRIIDLEAEPEEEVFVDTSHLAGLMEEDSQAFEESVMEKLNGLEAEEAVRDDALEPIRIAEEEFFTEKQQEEFLKGILEEVPAEEKAPEKEPEEQPGTPEPELEQLEGAAGDKPVELAMPVYTAQELLEKAHAAGDNPKVVEDPETGITILDYSDII